MNINKETAICFFGDGRLPLKYRNITNRRHFEDWIKKNHQQIKYINYYLKATKTYNGRSYIK